MDRLKHGTGRWLPQSTQMLGFGFLELLVILAIVAILAAILSSFLLPAYQEDSGGQALPDDPNIVNMSLPGSTSRVAWRASIDESTPNPCAAPCSRPAGLKSGAYVANIDLAAVEASTDGLASQQLVAELDKLTEGERVKFKLVPIFSDGKLRPESPSKVFTYEFRGMGDPSPVQIPFIVHDDARGCASMWVSVWNEAMTIALDSIAINVLTGTDAEQGTCGFDEGARSKVISGNGSILRLLGQRRKASNQHVGQQSGTSVGLHAFEMNNFGKAETRVVVVIDMDQVPEVFGWTLPDTLSTLLNEAKVARLLTEARIALNANDPVKRASAYKGLADYLARGIFLTQARDGLDSQSAKAAYDALRGILVENPDATLTAQFTTTGGSAGDDVFYVPLRVLTQATPALADGARIVYPIPTYSLQRGDCISRWTVAVMPPSDASVGRSAIKRILDRPSRWWSAETIITIEELRNYLRRQEAQPPTVPAAEGFLLLAHHNAASGIYFSPNDVPIISNEVNRWFGPGSAAMVAMCSATAPGSANGVIKAFTDNGIETMIASPFQVQEQYSAMLVEAFLAELDSAYSRPGKTRVSDLFDGANKRVAAEFPYADFAQQNLEFLVAGNPEATICGLQ